MDFVTGYKQGATMASDIEATNATNELTVQKAKLQKQYLPEHMANASVQEALATQKQQAEVQKLQATIKGDAEAEKIMREEVATNKDLPFSEILSRTAKKLTASGASSLGSIEGLAKLSTQIGLQEAQTQTQKAKAEADKRQKQIGLANKYPWDQPDQVEVMILEGQKDGLIDANEGNYIRNSIAKLGPQKAKAMLEDSLKTEEQRDRDLKRIQEGRLAEEKLKEKKALDDSLIAMRRTQEATQREAVGDRKQRDLDRKQAEKDKLEAKKEADKNQKDNRILNNITNLEIAAGKDKELAKLEEAISAEESKSYWVNEDEKRKAGAAKAQAAYDALYEKKYGKAIKDLKGRLSDTAKLDAGEPTPTEKPAATTSQVPPYGAWIAQARAANPKATEADLKAYYDKKYGKK